MNKFLKKNWFNILIGIIIVINVIFVICNFVILKGRKESNPQFPEEAFARSQIDRIERSEFYDTPCPEITLTSITGRIINLRDLVGNVIIIRFSKFYKRDLPGLIYLEHLAGKFKDKGISLIFVNSLGKHDSKAINNICYFSSPVIEDDGYISGLFNASPEEVIIIDRNFTIKFFYHLFNKTLIFNEVRKWIYGEEAHVENISHEELCSIMKRLTYYDVIEKKEKHLIVPELKKKIVLTLFTSTCTGCEENFRIQLLKELSSKVDPEKTQIILLFGIGNNSKAIRQIALINGWNEFPITIGVINNLDKHRMNDYYKLFQLNIDPRTFILNRKREIIFAENLKNSRSINLNFLIRKK